MTDSGFVIDVRSVPRRAGSMIEKAWTIQTPERLGAEMLGIPAGGDVSFDLRLESVNEGVLVTGTVGGHAVGQCSRCLDPIEDDITVFLTELFAYPNSATDKTASEEEDLERIIDEEIDLEQVVIDAIATDLPLSPLCTEDCPGLCQTCGIKLADAEPDHHHDLIDPRWAKLADKIKPGAEGDSK
ncbi:YceD family protein [Gordonia sp. (in: high G+C Gram-positive bacteria)]|uniref:YceD family protein n=1 Tax=Gordonia sp. (in: high G+C Gram-positive bacteria) TaxID=84139 RepID=UPI003C778A5F